MGTVSTRLSVDLSEFRAQLQQLMGEQEAAAARTEVAERKVAQAKRQVERLEPQVAQLERKLASVTKSMVRGGLATVGALALESLELDEGFAASGGRILSAAAVGGLYGGAPTAAIAAIGTTVVELGRAVRQMYSENAELRKMVGAIEERLAAQVVDLELEIEGRLTATKEQIRAEAEQKRQQAEQLMYQTSQYAEISRT